MNEVIKLEPYSGSEDNSIFALIEELPITGCLDDVDCSSFRICFKEDEDTPAVDYDAPWEVVERWFTGEKPLVLTKVPHDPSRFAPDLVFWSERGRNMA